MKKITVKYILDSENLVGVSIYSENNLFRHKWFLSLENAKLWVRKIKKEI